MSDRSRAYMQRLNASLDCVEEGRNVPAMANMSSNAAAIMINRQLIPVEDLTVCCMKVLHSEVGKMTANNTRAVNPSATSAAEPIDKSTSADKLGWDVNFSADKTASIVNTNVTSSVTSVSSTSMNAISNATTSDDEQQKALDQRKQKRMLSNRESAKRSRARRQQYLDDLGLQLAYLQAENDLMKIKYDIALQHYTRLIEENHVLRSDTIHLSHQLCRLHQSALAQQHAVGSFQSLGIEPEIPDPIPISSSYLLNCPQHPQLS